MLCDLSSVLNNDGAVLKISGKVDLAETKSFGVDFPDGVTVSGEITCRKDVLELSASVSGTFKTECARCLKELERSCAFDFSETLAQDGESVTDKDSVIIFSGYVIDISDIVESNVLLNLSSKYICSEDCKGICPKCGADLNKTTCECSDDEIDPRWEKLKNFK